MMNNLSIEFIDTHAHVFAKEFDTNFLEVEQRALAVGVSHILLPNIDVESIPALKKTLQLSKHCLGMMGLHPGYVAADYQSHLKQIYEELKNETYVAVGEIGLDFYWDTTFAKEQTDAFYTQLNWAKELKLPVAIHSRSAFDEAISLVEELQDGNLSGVFHCFSGSIEEAKRVEDVGFYYGIGGVLTYKNNNLKEVLPHLSLNKILLETDAPYLAPVPRRGKTNEPSFLIYIAEFAADILKIPLEHLAAQTTQNARQLFKI